MMKVHIFSKSNNILSLKKHDMCKPTARHSPTCGSPLFVRPSTLNMHES